MDKVFNFAIEISRLKKVKRKGITFYGVENPDSAVDHTFRTAIMCWLLGKKTDLNLERAIKISLVHNLCKVYTGDITPYDGLLPEDEKKKKEFAKSWRRLPQSEKEKRFKDRIKKERKAVDKLTSELPGSIKKEIRARWHEYETANSPEGKFVRQLDTTENLIEALECYQRNSKFPTKPWWEHANEVIDHPILSEFLEEIKSKETTGKNKTEDMGALLDFFLEVGQLKNVKRRGVAFYGEKPETTTEHIFRVVILTWVLSHHKEDFNIEKLLKIALVHDICELYAGDSVPFEGNLKKNKEDISKFLNKWPYFTQEEKKKSHQQKFEREKKSLEKLTKNLSQKTKTEIINLWLDFENHSSQEGRFVKQVDRIENLLEAFECWARNREFPFHLWWQYAEQVINQHPFLDFLEAVEKEHQKLESN